MKSGACAPYELYELKEQLELGELYEPIPNHAASVVRIKAVSSSDPPLQRESAGALRGDYD